VQLLNNPHEPAFGEVTTNDEIHPVLLQAILYKTGAQLRLLALRGLSTRTAKAWIPKSLTPKGTQGIKRRLIYSVSIGEAHVWAEGILNALEHKTSSTPSQCD
jgi:hypothetical protein